MKTTSAEWEKLLGEAERLLAQYVAATAGLTHASKGIRRSELFFFYALVEPWRPLRIVESGRARAQSTLVLAHLFPSIPVVSLESDAKSPDAAVAAERLRDFRNVDCRFGDSLILLPQIVQSGDVVLIDGPKDFRALKLAFHLLGTGKPAAVFVHDLWLGSPARRFVDRHLPFALLSDESHWVERYAALDSSKQAAPAPAGARRAYGATMGCFDAGADDYSRRLAQCRVAQAGDRLRATARKLFRRPAPVRPKDFEVVSP
ncbi:MAG: hypothetical protein H0T83_02150 [Chthoniobacterales bacterium]|nr:hypothetical protein [Chthoniobacterales bacterium]